MVSLTTRCVLLLCPVDARGPLVNDKGEETVVALEFNITQVPALLYYSYGPKKVVPSHVISAELVASLIGRGLKPFLRCVPAATPRVRNTTRSQPPDTRLADALGFRLLRNFLPSRVSQVKELGMNKFLTFDTPELQRVLLVTKKKLSPMPYDRLSLQFERRAGSSVFVSQRSATCLMFVSHAQFLATRHQATK